jgi:pimeloyl-ACP methyl ester carboxylesterase
MNPEQLKEWKKSGVIFLPNARTGQQMPFYIDIRNDYYEHHAKMQIEDAVRSLHIPLLFVHGEKDETVNVREAGYLNSWNLFSKLEIIPNANHTFGGRHPWPIDDLPDETKAALKSTIAFFRENL